MNQRRLLSVALAVAAAMTLATGSLGYSSVSADRGVQVNVVQSENAYVGVVACAKGNGNGNGAAPVRIWVTNQYSSSFTVQSVEWAADAGGHNGLSPNDELDPGETAKYNSAFGGDEVVVNVTAPGFNASVTVDVHSKWACPRRVGGQGTATATTTSPTVDAQSNQTTAESTTTA
ncbi:MAG: hypothetical protein ABEJ88_09315 [Halobacterium sp.]